MPNVNRRVLERYRSHGIPLLLNAIDDNGVLFIRSTKDLYLTVTSSDRSFPFPSPPFLDQLRKFPVRSFNVVAENRRRIRLLACSRPKPGARNAQFPCIFPEYQRNGGDGFAPDCVHRHSPACEPPVRIEALNFSPHSNGLADISARYQPHRER